MPYLLTCPTCGHQTRSPFVRVGAVVDCAGCRQRYEIHAAHVRRLIDSPAEAGPAEASPPASDADAALPDVGALQAELRGPVHPAPAPAAPLPPATPRALTMPANAPAPPPAPGPAAVPGTYVQALAAELSQRGEGYYANLARRRAIRRQRQALVALVLILLGLAAVIGAGLWVAAERETSLPATQSRPATDLPSSPSTDRPAAGQSPGPSHTIGPRSG